MTDRFYFMLEELTKLCASDVSRAEALEAQAHLKRLEEEKPAPEEITRGTVAGGLVGLASNIARSTVKGDLPRAISNAVHTPTVKGKALALGKSLATGLHDSAAATAGSATFGALMPHVRGHLEREAEKDKIRQYLGTAEGGEVRRKSKKYLGI
jgi:hypothetical protein